MTWPGRPRGWARIRTMVLVRDGYRCQVEDCPTPDLPADSVDHRIPRRVRVDHSIENLRAAHGTCNSRKGGRTDPPARVDPRWTRPG